MIPDRSRQLLTAYVDGELTARQRRLVARLLRRSEEARQLLQQLQEDAQALRHLPCPRLESDLSASVLRTIAERRLSPNEGRLAKINTATSWFGPLTSLAAAATVLLSLGMTTYYFFVASNTKPTTVEVAATTKTSPLPAPEPDRVESSVALGSDKNSPSTKNANSPPSTQVTVDKSVIVRQSDEKKQPAKVDKTENLSEQDSPLTDRLEKFQLDRVADTLPVIVKLKELDEESGRKAFLEGLSKDRCFRVELPCAHGSRAFERVELAARQLKLDLLIEKQAQERIKAKWRTSYLLYLENLSPHELTRLVQQIGIEDRNHPSSKKEIQFDALVLSPMTPQQRKECVSLLGFDLPVTESAVSTSPGGDPRIPLADKTGQEVAKSLAGQGVDPRPGSDNSTTKPAAHHALVLPLSATQLAPSSEEVKRFLDTRKPVRPGSICVLIVLRS